MTAGDANNIRAPPPRSSFGDCVSAANTSGTTVKAEDRGRLMFQDEIW